MGEEYTVVRKRKSLPKVSDYFKESKWLVETYKYDVMNLSI